jgi:hypothetical protein
MRYAGYEKSKDELLKKQPGRFTLVLYFSFKLPFMIWLLIMYWTDLLFDRIRRTFTR